MTTKNKILMQQAKASLKDKWPLAIVTFLIYLIIVSISSYASIIVAGPFAIGAAIFSLKISNDNEPKIEQLFDGFKNFVKGLITYLLILIKVFLWSLLLIIPGIIVALSYSMTYFILAENPDLSPKEAMKQSKELMDGYKSKYFILSLTFLGLGFLCLFTLGIAFLWLIPFIYITNAKFYEDIKKAKGSVEILNA